jgi:hypothetical protein
MRNSPFFDSWPVTEVKNMRHIKQQEVNTMKRLLFVVMALALTFALVNPVFAAGPQAGNPKGVFSLVGKITAMDAASKTVTVEVVTGNILVKSYIKKSLTLTTTATTRFLAKEGTTVKTISFADLKVGKGVSVSGKTTSGVWTADRITVGASLIHLQ